MGRAHSRGAKDKGFESFSKEDIVVASRERQPERVGTVIAFPDL